MPGWSFAEVWTGIAAEVPDRDALVCGDRRVTWGELEERAARLASYLWDAGLRAGDKVALDMVNRPEFLETFFAAQKIGCVPVNVNYRYVADEVRYVLENSDAKAIVHDADFAEAVHEAIARMPGEARPVTLETGAAYEAALAASPPAASGSSARPTATT